METIVVDGENAVVGRMGSWVAKQLLKGDSVVILNAEKAIVSGDPGENIADIVALRDKGGSSQKGPQISSLPDRMLKRMIRGMLPFDRTRGREAWRRLKCYTSYANDVKEKNGKKFFDGKLPAKYVTIKQICELLTK